jgi:post-segregation antitoxin (ccd killing protein)
MDTALKQYAKALEIPVSQVIREAIRAKLSVLKRKNKSA